MPVILKKIAAKKALAEQKASQTPIVSEKVENKLDEAQVEKASKALVAYLKTKNSAEKTSDKKNTLLEDVDEHDENEQAIWLIVSTKKVPEKRAFKPSRISLKKPLVDEENFTVCIFTKDPQRVYKDAVIEQGVKPVKKVIGLSKLKKKYKPYEAKRLLCKSFDLFLTDERIVHHLPKALGKTFFEKRRLPIPVDLSNPAKLHEEVARSISSTVFRPVMGPCNSIKIATTSFKAQEIVENIMEATPHIVRHIPKGWSNIQSISIKAPESVALPIYQAAI